MGELPQALMWAEHPDPGLSPLFHSAYLPAQVQESQHTALCTAPSVCKAEIAEHSFDSNWPAHTDRRMSLKIPLALCMQTRKSYVCIYHILGYWEGICSKVGGDWNWTPRLQINVTCRDITESKEEWMALLTEELQKLDKSTFSTLQSCLAGNISLQMDKPGSSRGNGEPINARMFLQWLATVLWSKIYFLQLFSVNASESFNRIV